MPSKKRKYEARFPPARIKKIMQTDEEIGKVAAAVPVIISRSLEIFLQSLVETTAQYTNERKAKTMTTSHLKHCIENEGKFDFLKDLVVNIADIANPDEEEGEVGEKPKKPRKPRQSNPEKKKKKKESSSEDESDIQSDGDESGSAQTSFPSSPNPSGNISNLPVDIPPINIPPIDIPPIDIPPINIPPISVSLDPITKSSTMLSSPMQQGSPLQRSAQLPQSLHSPRNAQMSHGTQSPRSVHSPLGLQSPQGIPSPQGIQSPRAVQSPRAAQSPRNTSPMDGCSPMVSPSALNMPSPLISLPRNMPSPRNAPSPSYASDVQVPQINAATGSKISPSNPLIPQATPLKKPVLQVCSSSPAAVQTGPPQASQLNAPMPQMDGISPQDVPQRPPVLPQRPSHSIDAIMGNITSTPSQQQYQQRQFQPPSHPSISSNFMPNFNLQGNGKSVPTISTTFRPNFSSPFQVPNDEEDDDYDA